MLNFKLYSYFRSSSAYRVRIALELKSIAYEYLPVHLIHNGGEQNLENYSQLNPMNQVPTLVVKKENDKPKTITQSMAIIQFIESYKPTPPLVLKDNFTNAKITEVCEIINSGIQPIQNLKVMQTLAHNFKATDLQKKQWSHDVIQRGFIALEKKLQKTKGLYSFGDQITYADLFLIPQIYNAHRFDVDMTPFKSLKDINHEALKLEAFQKAAPHTQPDTPEELR